MGGWFVSQLGKDSLRTSNIKGAMNSFPYQFT